MSDPNIDVLHSHTYMKRDRETRRVSNFPGMCWGLKRLKFSSNYRLFKEKSERT